MMKPKSNISLFKPEESSQKSIELNPFEMPIKASGYGSFSSPSLDFPEDKINLQELLIKDEECTFYGRISGDYLAGLGIFDKGIVGIQKGLTPNLYEYFNLEEHCLELRSKVLNGLDIPTSIGIAPTKTLAKVANKIAKKYTDRTKGVYVLDTPKKIEKALKWFPFKDVWGIGRRYFEKFKKDGVKTAWDFTQLPESYIRGRGMLVYECVKN